MVAFAVQNRDSSPAAVVEIQVVPGAAVEGAAAQLRGAKLRVTEGAAGESAARDGNALEVARGEGAGVELAAGPARVLECRGGEAGAGEGAGGELGKVEIKTRVGERVRLADEAGRGAACTFAPEVVVEDDELGGHISARSEIKKAPGIFLIPARHAKPEVLLHCVLDSKFGGAPPKGLSGKGPRSQRSTSLGELSKLPAAHTHLAIPATGEFE